MNGIIDILSKEELGKTKSYVFKKGDVLFNENDLCEGVSFVLKGTISISSFSYNGKEIVFNVLHDGDVFGNNLLFSSDPHYRGSVIALSNSKVLYISKPHLIYLLQNNEKFLETYLSIQSNFGIKLNSKIKMLSFDSAEERFFYFLYINNERIIFKNISSLAKELNLSRETVSRLIYRLIKENKIIKNKNIISLK